jgi:hypothetical protein
MEKQKKILIGVGAVVGIAAIYFIVRPKKTTTYVPTTVVAPVPAEKKPTDTWGKVLKGIDDLFKVYKKNTTPVAIPVAEAEQQEQQYSTTWVDIMEPA